MDGVRDLDQDTFQIPQDVSTITRRSEMGSLRKLIWGVPSIVNVPIWGLSQPSGFAYRAGRRHDQEFVSDYTASGHTSTCTEWQTEIRKTHCRWGKSRRMPFAVLTVPKLDRGHDTGEDVSTIECVTTFHSTEKGFDIDRRYCEQSSNIIKQVQSYS